LTLKGYASMLEKSSIAQRRSALTATSLGIPVKPAAVGSEPLVSIQPLQAEARWSLRMSEHDVAKVKAVAGFQLDQPVNRFHKHDGRTATRLGPDEWLLLGPEADAEMIASELANALKGQHHALVDISHRNVALTVNGPAAAAVLNAGCPLDLHPEHFPPGMATRTLLGKCEVLLFRVDQGGDAAIPSYRIECWRSFATYVSAFLAESAREFHAIPSPTIIPNN
jgi:sarcosine oxidase, subunit gamma